MIALLILAGAAEVLLPPPTPKPWPTIQIATRIQATTNPAASSVGTNLTLTWTPSSDPTAVQQNLYWGPQSQLYTNMAGFGDNTTSTFTVSNITSRTFFSVSALDQFGDESFSDEVFWPPYTNIVVFTSIGTNLSTSTNPSGPWTDTGMTNVCLTNPPAPTAQFFKGNQATFQLIIQ